MSLKSALNALDEAVKDLTSLHVQTFSGTLNLDVKGNESFTELKKELVDAGGKVTLVAESLIKFDGDSYNFVAQDVENVADITYDVHLKAVKAGLDTRQGLLTLFKGLITGND